MVHVLPENYCAMEAAISCAEEIRPGRGVFCVLIDKDVSLNDTCPNIFVGIRKSFREFCQH